MKIENLKYDFNLCDLENTATEVKILVDKINEIISEINDLQAWREEHQAEHKAYIDEVCEVGQRAIFEAEPTDIFCTKCNPQGKTLDDCPSCHKSVRDELHDTAKAIEKLAEKWVCPCTCMPEDLKNERIKFMADMYILKEHYAKNH